MEDFYAMCSTGDGDKMEASMCELGVHMKIGDKSFVLDDARSSDADRFHEWLGKALGKE